jgi:hypothetical protein
MPHAARATSAPASRRQPEAAVAARVTTWKPGPPIAVITTLLSAGPLVAISPAVVQPMSGTSPVRSRIPASSSLSSWASEQKTTTSFASLPRSAAPAASSPALRESESAEPPTPSQRACSVGDGT